MAITSLLYFSITLLIMRLPFDAHNHIHMGPSPPMDAVVPLGGEQASMSGMAIMSTHPQDFETVESLATTMRSVPTADPGNLQIVPCYGVHPWFLHELEEDKHWAPSIEDATVPTWLYELEARIQADPRAIVGEIGLDGFHFDAETGELTSSMEAQVEAFEAQMAIAAKLERPVSVHAVQCMGPMLTSLTKLKKRKALPPKVYFHAFGAKVGTVDQLLALCGRKPGQIYFGFAPVVNFRSPKTADVIRKVGLERLVLETDHEDAGRVLESMEQGIYLISEALNESRETVIDCTTQNAFDLYGLGNQEEVESII
jgi:Tat protein secretion system quality control protein TatD with DNase activity